MSRPLRPSRRVLAVSAAALTLVLTTGTGIGLAAADGPVGGGAVDVPPRPSLLQPASPEPPDDRDAPDGAAAPEDAPEPDEEPAPEPPPPDDDPAPDAPEPDEDPAEARAPAPGGGAGVMPAITVRGNQILRDGQPWWFLGYNSFVWSGDCGNPDEKMTTTDVENWFASMRHDGHGAVRLFFYDGWDLDRLDAAAASARRHNIYLTITLDDAIGGCGENDKTADWFADRSERDTFRNHMETLLQRYRGDTTFAWFEYFNEPDYEDGALREFYDEMGTAADRIDPDRLFSSGTVAPYWVDGDDNFADIHASPGVDIASLHEYDQDEIESNHGDDVRANSAGKPVIVGEFGIEACNRNDFTSRARRVAAKAEAYTGIDGYAGAFTWAWQPGGGGCELGNLDADEATQEVLREAGSAGR